MIMTTKPQEITGEGLAALDLGRPTAKWSMEMASKALRGIQRALTSGQGRSEVASLVYDARGHVKDALTAVKRWKPETREELTRRAVRRVGRGRV
ncbi:MAG: hypothetical protein M0R37_12030 [Bacteroidales bacterium]|jgi:hypothetical protein|nr:hypothetical protein [Bacteroidales bacterium]